jgi:hypothetical protein
MPRGCATAGPCGCACLVGVPASREGANQGARCTLAAIMPTNQESPYASFRSRVCRGTGRAFPLHRCRCLPCGVRHRALERTRAPRGSSSARPVFPGRFVWSSPRCLLVTLPPPPLSRADRESAGIRPCAICIPFPLRRGVVHPSPAVACTRQLRRGAWSNPPRRVRMSERLGSCGEPTPSL